MSSTKEQARKNLTVLVAKFKSEFESGKTQNYNEEATKTAFIQPLLKDVLGWDVNNNDEVSPEERVSRDRVDYGLKINGKTVMFVEAKPVKADLDRHIEQAIKYGFNRRDVPFVMLTDFEGIMLFDTTIKPNFKNLKKGMKLDIPWKEYLSSFDELWILSKESVLAGKLDELIKVKPKDRITIDKAILEDLEGWREKLAKDIYKNNHALFNSGDSDKDGTYLKEITQKILDRIIFMRFCEDRNLSNRPTLKSIFADRNEAVGTKAMSFVDEEFKHYNYIFNSDLFGQRDWDGKIVVDIKPLKEIILATYDPYLFDVIPLEVLGNIYEQYLGYTIKLTEHQAKYELKPEVRKAGGVYYTPKYIVDYIVKNTVGKVLEESTPAKIKKLSILDPACGSGSFLIRAYEEMLNYYRGLKVKGDKILEGQAGFGIRGDGKERELTIWEKAEILKRHIYGVDIDEQAVEVTKLSLMLKMLEGEQGLVAGRNVLPMLDKNIKCGNSLISGDSQELFKYFGKDYWKVKPFNWKEEFKHIMVDEGGFDVVVGNPPYVKEYTNREVFEEVKNTDMAKYYQGKMDLWYFFTCKALDLMKEGGLHSYIAQNNWVTSMGASILRNKIISTSRMLSFFDFNDFRVFKDASIQTMIFVLKKVKTTNIYSVDYYKIVDKNILQEELSDYLIAKKDCKGIQGFKTKINPIEIKDKLIVFVNAEMESIFEKMRNSKVLYLLKQEITNGLQVQQECVNKSHLEILGDGFKVGEGIFIISDDEEKKLKLSKNEKELIRPLFTPQEIDRYEISNINHSWVIYTGSKFKNPLEIKPYPQIKEHLDKFKKIITTDFKPYGIHRTRNEEFFKGEKIVSIRKCSIPSFSFVDFDSYVNQVYNVIKTERVNMKYLTGLLNSRLIYFWLYYNGKKQGEQLQIDRDPLIEIPIIWTSDKNIINGIISLVDIMLSLNKKLQTAQNNEKDQLQRQIDQTDKEIDELVYKLYGITEEEKKIIEGKI